MKFAKVKKRTMIIGCGCLEYVFIYMASTLYIIKKKKNQMDLAKIPKFLVWRKKNEGLIKGCTSKRNEAGNCGKVASFLLLYDLVKRFVNVSFTTNLVVNYLLNS